MSDISINVKIGGVETAVKTIGEIEATLKATKQELKGVEEGSVAFENLSKQAQKLQFKFKEIFNNQDYAFGLALAIVFCMPFLALLK